MRWWFRCLGASRSQERELFGGVNQANGDEDGISSNLIVRVRLLSRGTENVSTLPSGDNPLSYLFYFAGKSNRWTKEAALPPGTRFEVHLTLRRKIGPELETRWNQTLLCFQHVGAIGYRATRTAGAFSCETEPLTSERFTKVCSEMEENEFLTSIVPNTFGDWDELVEGAGRILKMSLRKGRSANKVKCSLGYTGSKERQSSAVRLRPIRLDGKLRLFLFEAPHLKVLAPAALRMGQILHPETTEIPDGEFSPSRSRRR
jgi:hypothetical protein